MLYPLWPVLYLLWCGCVKQRKHHIAMLQCFTTLVKFCIYCGVVVSSRGNITLQCYSVLPTLVSFVFIVVWLCQAEETSHCNVTVFYHLGKFCIYCGVLVSSRGNITSQLQGFFEICWATLRQHLSFVGGRNLPVLFLF